MAAARTPPKTFDDLYGLEVEAVTAADASARLEVSDRVRQPFGLVHGGVYASMAEALATLGTIEGIASDELAVGQSNHTSFLRPAAEGFVHAEARRRHRGRTSWVWEIDFTDDAGRLCAISRVTMAVRPAGRTAGSSG